MDPILIPILAILGAVFIAYTGITRKSNKNPALSKEMINKLEAAYEENQSLTERVKNLEYIVTSLDKDILRLHAPDNTENPDRQIEALKDEIKRLKSGGNEEDTIGVS